MLNWYLQTSKDTDVVIASKVSLARNLSQFNFYISKEEEILQLESLIKENLLQIGYGLKFLKLKDLEELELQSLLEKGLITSKIVQGREKISILINDEENICIIINNNDHIRIQVFTSGLELEEITRLCVEIDQKFGQFFNFSKSSKYGFLTASPTNVGTGMKMSVSLHLPGLTKTNNISKLIKYVGQFGIEISKKQNPDIYKISNERTLGITEEDIVKSLKSISEKIIEQERAARKILTENQVELEDIIFRSYGILTNCKKISLYEAEDLLSNLKLGTDLGILTNLTDSKIKKLYLYIKQASLSKYFGQELTLEEQEIKRAELIKQICKD